MRGGRLSLRCLRGTATIADDANATRAGIERQSTRYLGPKQGSGMAATIHRSPHVLVHIAVEPVTASGFDNQH